MDSNKVGDKNTLLSIVLPTYNAEKYIEKCLETIVNQTYQNIELIIIDDGSTDSSFSTCKKYSEKYSFIKLIRTKNQGAANARNEGMKYITGDYISFVDSDDWLDLNMYQEMMDIILNTDSDIVICGRFDVNDDVVTNGFCYGEKMIITGKELLNDMLIYNSSDFALWDKIYKKELWEGVSFPVGHISEDLPVLYNIVLRAKSVSLLNNRLYYHVYRSGSVTSGSFNYRTFDFEYYAKYIFDDVKKNYPELIQNATIFRMKSLLYTASFSGKISKAEYIKYKKKIYTYLPELRSYKKYMNKKQMCIYLVYALRLSRLYYHLVYRHKG